MEYRASETKDEFLVTGDSGSTYRVNIISKSCSCPQYKIRLKGNGTCKHYNYLINNLNQLPENQQINKVAKQLLNEIRENKGMLDTDVDKFGPNVDTLLKQLEQEGEIYYDKRKRMYVVLE